MNVTGPYLEGPGSFTPQMHELKDAEDARQTVEFLDRPGSDLLQSLHAHHSDELAAAVKRLTRTGSK